jgi:CTP synthase
MEGQEGLSLTGGTMRLGTFDCRLDKGSLASKSYKRTRTVRERHRHRYELNNRFRERLNQAGLRFSGLHPELNLVEIIELPEHPWFLATQFHPEYSSTVDQPHPLFVAFLKAALQNSSSIGLPINS